MKIKKYIVSLIHPYYVEYGIVSPVHIVDKKIEANGVFDLIKKVKKQYPKYHIDGIKKDIELIDKGDNKQ